MIRFEQVSKSLGGRLVLDRIDLEIRGQETFVIVGSSGAGKSVSLKHMVRLLTPDVGRVWVGDECVSAARGHDLERIRARFGYLFQGGALLQWLTVGDNVGLPLRERTRQSPEQIDRRVKATLDKVGLAESFSKFPDELSGGMRKRVGLARAIITDPDIILYDEPTSGLDPVTSRTIDHLIDELRRDLGVTSVVVTHDLHSALSIGTRIAMLHDGRVVEESRPEDFVRSDHEEVRRFLEAQYIGSSGPWEDSMAP
jgi:phospholipid/cholesterol/gamma-HCH transport system ATP-binding protein